VGFTFVDSRQARSGGIGISTERDFALGKARKTSSWSKKYTSPLVSTSKSPAANFRAFNIRIVILGIALEKL
jgi:hypothetical protein